jgi:hypothetical protein
MERNETLSHAKGSLIPAILDNWEAKIRRITESQFKAAQPRKVRLISKTPNKKRG